MLHVVKDTEDDLEDVIPPVSQECIPVSLQYFKHYSQASVHTAKLPIHFTLCTYSLTHMYTGYTESIVTGVQNISGTPCKEEGQFKTGIQMSLAVLS